MLIIAHEDVLVFRATETTGSSSIPARAREVNSGRSAPKPGLGGVELALSIPDELVAALAERVALLVVERGEATGQAVSPWLDFEAAMAYLGFSRDRLYKLTSARAIPFRKKRDGQGLLFHRDELDRWIEAEYESTGCARQVELWSSTTRKMPRQRSLTTRGRQRRD